MKQPPKPKIKISSKIILLIIILVLILLSRVSKNKQTHPATLSTDDYSRYHNKIFRCTKVIDGDTFDINVPDPKRKKKYTRIRLWGIDTPEIPHRGSSRVMYFGYEATEYARKLLLGKNIRLELIKTKTRGYYGRLLAYVYLPDGRMFNKIMIQDGYAYADRRFQHPRKEEFIKLEEQARLALKGLWKKVEPKDLPKWYKKSWLDGFWNYRKRKTIQTQQLEVPKQLFPH